MLDQLLDPRVTDTRTPAIGYIRVSLAREEMISPELQRTSIEEWAEKTGHRIIDWVIDLDKSGRNFKRKIMGAIERVEAGEAKVIAVWKYSRFGRSSYGTRANLDRVERAGGRVLTSAETVDTTTPEGRLQRGIIMEFNSYESDRAGVQWEETHRWRRENGLPATGKRRFGYDWTQRKRFLEDGTVILQDERYEPSPVTGPVLAALYERFLDGESFRGLALWLNEQGYKTAQDRHWSAKAVIRVMDSGFAAGYLRLHKSDCPIPECTGNCANYTLARHPEKHHPVVIDDSTWQRYLARREERRALPPRARVAAYPHTGIFRCGRCGAAMKRQAAGGTTTTVRYVCTMKAEKGSVACKGTSASVPALNASLSRFLEVVASRIDQEARQVQVVAQVGPQKSEKELLQERAAKLGRAISKHMRAYALSDDDDPDGSAESEYRAVLAELTAEKAGLEAQLAKHVTEEARQDPQAKRRNAAKVAKGLLEEWRTLAPDRVNFLLRFIIEKAVVQPDRRIDYHPAWLGGAVWTDVIPEPVTKAMLVTEAAERMLRDDPGATARRIAGELQGQGMLVSEGYVRAVVRELRVGQRSGDRD